VVIDFWAGFTADKLSYFWNDLILPASLSLKHLKQGDYYG
jgi:hypothetical protein